jgi:hypothetical protein
LKRQHILSIDGQKEIEIHGEEGRENSSRYKKIRTVKKKRICVIRKHREENKRYKCEK